MNKLNIDKELLRVVKLPDTRKEQAKILREHPATVSHKAIALGFRRVKFSNRIKLDEGQRLELQERFLNGESLKMLKDRFKVCTQTIYKIGYSK